MKKHIFKINLAILAAGLLLNQGISMADEPKHHKPRKPPKEAYEACAEMQEGDIVSIETREGNLINATCEVLEEELVAVPEDAPPRKKRRHDKKPDENPEASPEENPEQDNQ